ncbi:hypothetical protein BHM03_00032628 [Ensete ventricosum]|nr:hypothetical protein BHM03_00032628 [Ensete ventricosum]
MASGLKALMLLLLVLAMSGLRLFAAARPPLHRNDDLLQRKHKPLRTYNGSSAVSVSLKSIEIRVWIVITNRERERGHGDDEAAGVVAATGCELATSDDGGEADERRVVARARRPLAAVAASRAGDAVAAFVLHP